MCMSACEIHETLLMKSCVFTGSVETALRGESSDFSHVQWVTLLMIVGVVTPIGNRIVSAWLTVVSVLGAMRLVVGMEDSM